MAYEYVVGGCYVVNRWDEESIDHYESVSGKKLLVLSSDGYPIPFDRLKSYFGVSGCVYGSSQEGDAAQAVWEVGNLIKYMSPHWSSFEDWEANRIEAFDRGVYTFHIEEPFHSPADNTLPISMVLT